MKPIKFTEEDIKRLQEEPLNIEEKNLNIPQKEYEIPIKLIIQQKEPDTPEDDKEKVTPISKEKILEQLFNNDNNSEKKR